MEKDGLCHRLKKYTSALITLLRDFCHPKKVKSTVDEAGDRDPGVESKIGPSPREERDSTDHGPRVQIVELSLRLGQERKEVDLVPGAGREETDPDLVAGRKEIDLIPGARREETDPDLVAGREETDPDPVAGRKEVELVQRAERGRGLLDLTSILTISTNQSINTDQLVQNDV